MLRLQHPSTIKEHKENHLNPSNRSHIIDSLIEESCRYSKYPQNALRWMPFENFGKIECFAQGEFAEIALTSHKRNECQPITGYEKEIPDDIALRFIKNSRVVDEKFVNEIRTHHKCMIHSQNVIPLYGLTQDPRTLDYALVLKHARHGDLRNFLRKNLTWPEKLNMLIKIAKTLKEIHELDLVHRDFHCKNILVDGNNDFLGNGFELFVSDFGLCMDVSSSKTDLNVIEGVLPYIAPEILLGSKYSPKTDVYSFSMIMWELVSDQSPYHEYQVHDIRLALDIIKGVRPEIPDGTPDDFRNLINACWSGNPAHRPDSMQLLMMFENMLRKRDDNENKSFDFENAPEPASCVIGADTSIEVSREVKLEDEVESESEVEFEEEDYNNKKQVDSSLKCDALDNVTEVGIVDMSHKQAADGVKDPVMEGNIFMLKSIAKPKSVETVKDVVGSVDKEPVQHEIGAVASEEKQMDLHGNTTNMEECVPEDTYANVTGSTDSKEVPPQLDATNSQDVSSSVTDLSQLDSDFEAQVPQTPTSVPFSQSSDLPLEHEPPSINNNDSTTDEELDAGDPTLERMANMLNSLITEATESVKTPVQGREKTSYKQFDSSKIADIDFSDINNALDEYEESCFDEDEESLLDEEDSSSEVGEEDYERGRDFRRGNKTPKRSKSRNEELFEYSMKEFNKSLTELDTFVNEMTMTDDTVNETSYQYWDPEEGPLGCHEEPLEDLDDFSQQCRLLTRALILPFLKFTHTFMSGSLRKEEIGTIQSVLYIIYWTFLFTLGALVLDAWLCEVSGRQVIRLLIKLGQLSFDNRRSYDAVSKVAPRFNPGLPAEYGVNTAGPNEYDSSNLLYGQTDPEDPRYKTQVYAFTVNDIIHILNEYDV